MFLKKILDYAKFFSILDGIISDPSKVLCNCFKIKSKQLHSMPTTLLEFTCVAIQTSALPDRMLRSKKWASWKTMVHVMA